MKLVYLLINCKKLQDVLFAMADSSTLLAIAHHGNNSAPFSDVRAERNPRRIFAPTTPFFTKHTEFREGTPMYLGTYLVFNIGFQERQIAKLP